ncbi:MAG TPA: glycosyltransferase [Thermoanaerobaculia bacterium]|nr:glycosyltransferase [Thermoanaerobaculia bacterium]
MTDSNRDTQTAVHELREARRERDAAYRQLEAAYRQLEKLSRELHEIHSSHLWKVAGIYWRLRKWLSPARGRRGPPEPDLRPEGGDADAVRETLSSARPSACDVICFPIIDWDFRFQRPQQLMRRYATAGHRVFYVSQNFFREGPPYRLVPREKNVVEVGLRGPELNVYRDSLGAAGVDALLGSLDALRRDLSLASTAAVLQLPFWWPLARRARERFGWTVVYDCMDLHAGFSTNRPEMLDQEEDLLVSADAVMVSSELLRRRASELRSSVTLVRNAADYEHFAGERWRKGARPVVGYYGAIAEWFDADLLADVAERRPDWDFVLVGSTYGADVRRLSRLPHVSLVGEKPYAEIPRWLAGFDVAVIPFRRTPLTEATDPVKAYEILAAGKPLVAVPLPELEPLGSRIRRAEDAQGFVREIAAALDERDPSLVEERRAFARDNTWDARFRAMDAAVSAAFPKVSIVVVTFNNRALTARCLDSLFSVNEWPNFEVIVVDNASSDGTLDDLREMAGRRPSMRLLENPTNAGFAAANNRGLALATGEILVMLNNDTVVTRGWLPPLVRRLRADPSIGMIGPTTNEIGNEARVKVDYADLADMPSWAADFVRAHDGETFEIPVLAMFCTALRREVYESVGPLDERFGIGMFEDDDYARRVSDAGLRLVCVRDAFVHHEGGASFKRLPGAEYRRLFERNRFLYEQKWGSWTPHLDDSTRDSVPHFVVKLRQILREAGERGREAPFVFLPDRPWTATVPGRARALALALGRAGRLVFYDCTGSVPDRFAGFVEAAPRVWLYNGPRGVLDQIESPVLWATPRNASQVDRWASRTLAYDLAEDLSMMGIEAGALAAADARMRRDSDVIFCADRAVARGLGGPPRVRHLPGGGAVPAADGLRGVRRSRSRACAVTVLADAARFDAPLFRVCAREKPDWDFVLVVDADTESAIAASIEGLPNVRVASAPGSLAAAWRRADALFLPLRPDPPGFFPAALFDAFAAGVAAVSTPVPECAAIPEVFVAREPTALQAGLETARERRRSPEFASRLRAVAGENTWDVRGAAVLDAIRESAARVDVGPPGESGRAG